MGQEKNKINDSGFVDPSVFIFVVSGLLFIGTISLFVKDIHSNYVGKPIPLSMSEKFETMAVKYPNLRPKISRWLKDHKTPSPVELNKELKTLKGEAAKNTIQKLITLGQVSKK